MTTNSNTLRAAYFSMEIALDAAMPTHSGGLGILAGDGNLNYGLEQTLETYYRFKVWKTLSATADYQYVTNPSYNKDRGPVSIVSMRFHVEF